MVFVMLNPSTADAVHDDATIRRCIAFVKNFGCNKLIVANLYALRSRDPNRLRTHPDPVGPGNDNVLASLASSYTDIVCAWGAEAPHSRVAEFRELMDAEGAKLWCLGQTKHGAPRHPLYLPADSLLERWP